MSVAKSRTAYDDVFERFELALSDPKGIRIPFETFGEAKTYMLRMHNARALDRRDNSVTYPPGDPMHGQCIYDRLQCSIRQGEDDTYFLYVEPRDKHVGAVEMLSDIEADEPTSLAEVKSTIKPEAN